MTDLHGVVEGSPSPLGGYSPSASETRLPSPQSPDWVRLEVCSPVDGEGASRVARKSQVQEVTGARVTSGQLREPWEGATDSEETYSEGEGTGSDVDSADSERRLLSGGASGHFSSRAPGKTVGAKSQGRQKPNSQAREGHPRDNDFVTVSLIPPKEFVRENQDWVDKTYEELVVEECREEITREILSLRPPTAADRDRKSVV